MTSATPLPYDTQGKDRTTSPSNLAQQAEKEINISNEWRIYAKMECNYHLTNKFALFVNMSKYYKSIGRDPLDVLPLSFHIKKGNHDPTFFKFMQVFKELEEKQKEQEQELMKSKIQLQLNNHQNTPILLKENGIIIGENTINNLKMDDNNKHERNRQPLQITSNVSSYSLTGT